MKDLSWLTDLVSECVDFGETNGLGDFVEDAYAVIDALEKDLGIRLQLCPKFAPKTGTYSMTDVDEMSNILPFPNSRRTVRKPLKAVIIDPTLA